MAAGSGAGLRARLRGEKEGGREGEREGRRESGGAAGAQGAAGGRGAALTLVAAAGPGRFGDARAAQQSASRRAQRVPGPVVIIDDVVTTGSTLRGMHRALTDAGMDVLGAVVIASARMPTGSDGTR